VGEFKKTIRLKFHQSLIVFSLSFEPAAETVDRNISGPNSTKNVKWIKSIKKQPNGKILTISNPAKKQS
jgi:hypothetical protein